MMMTEAPSGYRIVRDNNSYAALGRAVSYLITKKPFAARNFGMWSRILIGQINRKHYFFVVDERQKTVGFAGWALVDEDKAEAWLDHDAPLPSAEASAGDCIIINAWAADNDGVNRTIVNALRREGLGKKIYAKRVYPDGTVRPVKLGANKFVASHLVD